MADCLLLFMVKLHTQHIVNKTRNQLLKVHLPLGLSVFASTATVALSLPNSFPVLQVYSPSWSAVAFERVRTEEELVVSTDIGADRGAYWKNHVTFGGGAPLKVQVRVSSNPNSVSCTNDVMFRTWGTPAINERSKAVLCNNESSM